jgi:hypothetical protein
LQYSVEQELADLPNCNVDQLKKAHVDLPPNVNSTSWLDTSKEYIQAFIRKCGPNVVGAEDAQAGKAAYFTLTGGWVGGWARTMLVETPLHYWCPSLIMSAAACLNLLLASCAVPVMDNLVYRSLSDPAVAAVCHPPAQMLVRPACPPPLLSSTPCS